MSRFILKTVLLFLSCLLTTLGNAQLPNEKFGKPSSMEWEYIGWREALDADALILCKTMKATFQLSDQVENFNQSSSEIGSGNFTDFSKNRASGFSQFPGQFVPVNHRITPFRQILADHGFSAGNTACKSDNVHETSCFLLIKRPGINHLPGRKKDITV